MSDISKIFTELLKFRENYPIEIDDLTVITINNLINKLYNTAKSNNLWWYPPKLSIGNADGTVQLEWEHKDKILLIDVLENRIEYDALWGLTEEASYGEESEDININNDLTGFWEWIAE